MSKSSKLRRFAQSLLVIVLVALSCFANGLEQQQQTLPSSSQPIRRRPFSGGKTRLTSSLPTEGVVIERSIKRRPSRILVPVVGLSCINVVFNMMRPDPDVGVIQRLPRVFWEACISCIAAAAMAEGSASILQLLLSMMLCPTALIDIFFWGPILGVTTSFESCTGGFLRGPKVCSVDYSKGIGRLVGMIQSIFGGSFYLLAAAVCCSEYWQAKKEEEVEARARARIVDFSYEH